MYDTASRAKNLERFGTGGAYCQLRVPAKTVAEAGDRRGRSKRRVLLVEAAHHEKTMPGNPLKSATWRKTAEIGDSGF